MREEKESGNLVIGGACRIDSRCIIPVVRALTVYGGGTAMVSLTPVALLVTEGEKEYLTLLPDAHAKTRDIIGTLRDEIEREKEKCTG
jgi:uncharacterized spore protein YtfJ